MTYQLSYFHKNKQGYSGKSFLILKTGFSDDNNDIKMISNILMTVHKLNPKGMVIIRSKVDQWNPSNARTIEEEKKIDAYTATELLQDKIETYCISSRNIENKTGPTFDWDIVKSKLVPVSG